MNLIDKVIEVFDGEIMVDNQWRVNGSNGKHYTVEWIRTIKITVVGVKVIFIERGVDTSQN